MIQKKHFHILEAISVLIFAILANFIFGLKIDFSQDINWISIIQLITLSISAFAFYFVMYKLRDIYDEAEKDDKSETDIDVKAKNPIMSRYKVKYDKEKVRVHLLIGVSIMFTVLFFLSKPLLERYC